MKDVKISIIMPVYNTGIYLEESLSSVFNQTFREVELICVDDCSEDALTKEILKKFQLKHTKMSVIFLEKNVGAGEARNIGLSKAQGEYVIFLDADDIFAEDMLSKMYEKAVSVDADVCACGYTNFYVGDNGKKYLHTWLHDEEVLADTGREDWLYHIVRAPWNKLCKMSFLKENGIYFQNLPSCNDLFYSCMVMKKARLIEYIDAPFIEYRCNTEIQISSNRNPCNFFQAVELLCSQFETDEISKRQLFVLCLFVGREELYACKNEKRCKLGYELLYNICLGQGNIKLSNLKAKFIYRNIMRHPLDASWLLGNNADFFSQLLLEKESVKTVFCTEQEVYIWGIGKRGNALQKFCKENDLPVVGVTDQKNENLGQKTEYGYVIVHTNQVLESDAMVIATNTKIYEALRKKYNYSNRVVNLEEFCPW